MSFQIVYELEVLPDFCCSLQGSVECFPHAPIDWMTYLSHDPEMIVPAGVVSSVQMFSVCPIREKSGSSLGWARLKTLMTAS